LEEVVVVEQVPALVLVVVAAAVPLKMEHCP
jgi:hypothetical protein